MVTKKKKKKNVIAEEACFELHGNVYIVEKINGKEVNRTELDGNLVLNCLVGILEKSLSEDEVRRKFKDEYSIRKSR
jgi:hypothetical protein